MRLLRRIRRRLLRRLLLAPDEVPYEAPDEIPYEGLLPSWASASEPSIFAATSRPVPMEVVIRLDTLCKKMTAPVECGTHLVQAPSVRHMVSGEPVTRPSLGSRPALALDPCCFPELQVKAWLNRHFPLAAVRTKAWLDRHFPLENSMGVFEGVARPPLPSLSSVWHGAAESRMLLP